MAISRIAVSRIAIGNREEFTHPGALKAALAEFFSTLIFVFAGQGASMAFSKLTGGMPLTPSGLVVAAVAHGFGLFAAVSVSFNISGGHVNPAVTFGVLLGGNISVIRAALYWIAQLAGSTAACLLLRFATGGLHTGVFALSGINAGNALVLEIVMTFGLVYTVYATAVDPGRRDLGTIAPLCIGFVLAANIFAGGAFDGASMNPAVSFGPALVSWEWADQWVYWVGPLVGGGIAGVVYDLFFITHTHEPLPADVAY